MISRIILLQLVTVVVAVLPLSAADTEAEKPAEDKGYIFRKTDVSGGGGGLLVMYGTGPELKDTTLVGGRGFVLLGTHLRLGGLGMGVARPGNDRNDHTGAGFGGFYGEYILRFDPLLVGFGLTLGGGGSNLIQKTQTTPGVNDKTAYAYFLAYPHLEFELRLFENVSMGIITGYAAMIGQNGAPDVSQFTVGLSLTFGKF